jgi:hypothetical protein
MEGRIDVRDEESNAEAQRALRFAEKRRAVVHAGIIDT